MAKKILVNEVFGPTIQGEGPFVGRPCIFLRLQGCPVQCPGCDTAYTWNGSEVGRLYTFADLANRLDRISGPNLGLVVSGGEPLIHYKNAEFLSLLWEMRSRYDWLSLETSGYIPTTPGFGEIYHFLSHFDSVSWSPKVTPCLHGTKSDDELMRHAADILSYLTEWDKQGMSSVKFVVRDRADLKVVQEVDHTYRLTSRGLRVELMPYGIEKHEVEQGCRDLVPMLAETGYVLSPRLHALLWGKQRGV